MNGPSKLVMISSAVSTWTNRRFFTAARGIVLEVRTNFQADKGKDLNVKGD